MKSFPRLDQMEKEVKEGTGLYRNLTHEEFIEFLRRLKIRNLKKEENDQKDI